MTRIALRKVTWWRCSEMQELHRRWQPARIVGSSRNGLLSWKKSRRKPVRRNARNLKVVLRKSDGKMALVPETAAATLPETAAVMGREIAGATVPETSALVLVTSVLARGIVGETVPETSARANVMPEFRSAFESGSDSNLSASVHGTANVIKRENRSVEIATAETVTAAIAWTVVASEIVIVIAETAATMSATVETDGTSAITATEACSKTVVLVEGLSSDLKIQLLFAAVLGAKTMWATRESWMTSSSSVRWRREELRPQMICPNMHWMS
mmetsp:Transcript_140310/g.349781  ORF Transcript_140310/g.349781 Transcript_140310/m.349781 type:complete len:272 (-) Transcript_140310:1916-2731(-)